MRHNQEKRKHESKTKDNPIKQLDIKIKNIKFKNNNINKKYKISIPNNYNIHKNIKFIKRRQSNELYKLNLLNNNKSAFLTNSNSSKLNKSPENIDNTKQHKNKINISYRNLNVDNYIYKKYQHKSFNLNTSKDKTQNNNSISYNINNSLESKTAMIRSNANNINISHNHNHKNQNSINGKIFNRLKLLNLKIANEEQKNNSKFINNKFCDKNKININFDFIPNNFQRYINNNTNSNSHYSLENIHNQTNINTSINNNKSKLIYFKKYLNNIKKNFNSKNKPCSLIKANSHSKLLEINIDSSLRKIKDLLNRNNNSKIHLKNLIKYKSFSQRINEGDSMNIPKKKYISKKHLLLNKIPKCIISSNTNRNNFDIPLYYKQMTTYNYKN